MGIDERERWTIKLFMSLDGEYAERKCMINMRMSYFFFFFFFCFLSFLFASRLIPFWLVEYLRIEHSGDKWMGG